MFKTALALVALVFISAMTLSAQAFGPKDLPIQDTSAGFGPKDLPTPETGAGGFGPKEVPTVDGPGL